MRKHRYAHIASLVIFVGLFSGLFSVFSDTAATQETTWTSSPTHASLTVTNGQDRIQMQNMHEWYAYQYVQRAKAYQLVIYSQAVEKAKEDAAAQAAAAQRAATPVVNTPSAPVSASGMWGCIIAHESGGNPTVVNASSGAGGLFQFLPSTWISNGGGQYAPLPEEATAAQQWAIAIATQARDGWSPWTGDGCVG